MRWTGWQFGCSLHACCEGNGPWEYTPWTYVFALWVCGPGWASPYLSSWDRPLAGGLCKPSGEAKLLDNGTLPTSGSQVPPPPETQEHFLPLSTPLSFQSFHLFTYFVLTRSQWISLPCDQQFITKTNGQNLSQLKHNPAIERIDSPNAPDGCQVLCFVWFTKVLFVQYECVSINYPSFD